MILEKVKSWIDSMGYGLVVSTRSVGGGCINHGLVLKTEKGESFFLKFNRHSPRGMFKREAEGLVALKVKGGPRVPKHYLISKEFLLLEDLAPANPRSNYWHEFGRQLATLHNYTNCQYGFSNDNFIGSTPQPNEWTDDGFVFFAEHRLMFQARLAQDKELLSVEETLLVEQIAERLPDLVPRQPASLIHGDLWIGNAITDTFGGPAIIDPAAHYGWAEAELAMTTLFGTFPKEFYHSYTEIRPLEAGFRSRFPIYNLYHLLNHLNLFGSVYHGQAVAVINDILL